MGAWPHRSHDVAVSDVLVYWCKIRKRKRVVSLEETS
jgi:hypothetical protein